LKDFQVFFEVKSILKTSKTKIIIFSGLSEQIYAQTLLAGVAGYVQAGKVRNTWTVDHKS
jgi:hypothetical protein